MSGSVPTRWEKGELLGRGAFGNVYLGFNSDRGSHCAIKEVLLVPDDSDSKERVKQLGQEISLLGKFRHPNIVEYIGTETLEDRLRIYLEYVPGGSVHKLLRVHGQFKEPVISSYTRDILCGLAYLHDMNTVHRDIKGSNILVDTRGNVKLADFGMAKHLTGEAFPLSCKGSAYWLAPEAIKQTNTYGLAVDIWSLGCTVIEMATGKPPWSQYEPAAAIFRVGSKEELPAIPDSLSQDGRDFVKLCLRRNPIERPTARELLKHPFVTGAPQAIPNSLSQDERDFVKLCLRRNPIERPTAQELLKHPFVTGAPQAIPNSLSQDEKDFVKLCLRRNPIERPTARELLKHPFVTDAPQAIPNSLFQDERDGTQAIPSSLSQIERRIERDFVKLCVLRNPIERSTARELLKHPFVTDAPQAIPNSLSQDERDGTQAIPNSLSQIERRIERDFVKLCLLRNPIERLTARELLKHPFVTGAPQVIPNSLSRDDFVKLCLRRDPIGRRIALERLDQIAKDIVERHEYSGIVRLLQDFTTLVCTHFKM